MRTGWTLVLRTVGICAWAIVSRVFSPVTPGRTGNGLIGMRSQGAQPYAGEYAEHQEPCHNAFQTLKSN